MSYRGEHDTLGVALFDIYKIKDTRSGMRDASYAIPPSLRHGATRLRFDASARRAPQGVCTGQVQRGGAHGVTRPAMSIVKWAVGLLHFLFFH
jgi:hypothetical protein